ncbi:MAG: hypothetical protein KJI70_03360 [Patescibacteria group bacterium]|nr:hypothetical protein [Patescibacteria group bacterium]
MNIIAIEQEDLEDLTKDLIKDLAEVASILKLVIQSNKALLPASKEKLEENLDKIINKY